MLGMETLPAIMFFIIIFFIPESPRWLILKGKEEIMSYPAIVPQLGEIKKFPVDVISSEGLMLEFYPQFGSLKSIRKK